MRLQNLYGTVKMQAQWPDKTSSDLARREFGKVIAKFSREQIFDWPDIDAIIGLLTNEGVFTGSAGTLCHKIYKPEQLLESGTKEERDATARIHLDTMLKMFD
jgi:hypothetical protein